MITKLFEESIGEEIQIPDIERFILDRIPRLYFNVTYNRKTSDKDRETIIISGNPTNTKIINEGKILTGFNQFNLFEKQSKVEYI